MEAKYFEIAQAGFVVLTIICLTLVLIGIRKTFTRMGIAAPVAHRKLFIITSALLVWLALVSILSLNGTLSNFSAFPPRLLIALLPPLIVVLWLTFHPSTKAFLAHVPASWLMYLQVFRVPVEIFLWLLFLGGLIPIQMTFEGRNWDVLTGLTAPVFAYICYAQGRHLKGLALLWNLFGLALLVNIVSTAILSMPTPFRVFMNEPANTIVAQFPFIFLPAVLVPLAYTLHFFSLRQAYLSRKSIVRPNSINSTITPAGTLGL